MSEKKSYRALLKAELIQQVKDHGLVPDDLAIDGLRKAELLEILEKSRLDDGAPTEFRKVVMEDHHLHPVAMCVHSTVDMASTDWPNIVAVDGATNAVWSVKLGGRTRITDTATHLYNFPPEERGRSVAINGKQIYCLSKKSLFILDLDGSCKVTIPSPSSQFHSICANDLTVIVSDLSGILYRLEGRELIRVSGIETESENLVSQDGYSLTAKHAQPGPVCMLSNSVFVADLASLSIRILTSVKPLFKYHQSIDQLYKAFSIHTDNHGSAQKKSTDTVIQTLQNVCSTLDRVVNGVRDVCKEPQLKPNGAQGSVPYVTVDMFHDLENNVKWLQLILEQQNPGYELHSASLLSDPCKHHSSVMRSRYPMPTLLQ